MVTNRDTTGSHFDRAKKIPKVAQATGTIDVFDPPSGVSGPELPHVQIFVSDAPNLLTLDAQLLSYWFSRNPVVFQY